MTRWRSSLCGLALVAPLLALPGAASAQTACGPGYRIMRGDTLAGISRACGVPAEALRRANPQIDWNLLRIGAAVRIPEPGPRRPPPPGRGGDVYVIQPGDTLRSVAGALGVTVDALLDVNPGLSQRDLIPGREVRLGGGRDAQPPRGPEIELSVRERSAEPGGFVTVEIDGLPPRAPVVLRAGPEGSRLSLRTEGRAGRDGRARVEIDVPERARGGERWRVEALDPRGRPVADGSFRIAGRVGGRSGVTVTGLLTREGVECPALRAEDGDLFTLSGRLGGFRPGDTVVVQGRVATLSTCQQGTTIDVESIDAVR